MATYVQTVTAGALNVPQTFTASNADATRMLNAHRIFFGQVSDGSGGMRDRTDTEVIQAIFADNIATIRQRTRAVEQTVAQKASVDSIQPIVFT